MLFTTASGILGIASLDFPPKVTLPKMECNPTCGFFSLRMSTISISSKCLLITPAKSRSGISFQYITAILAELGANPNI